MNRRKFCTYLFEENRNFIPAGLVHNQNVGDTSWKTCERQYDIVEFQVIGDEWNEINRTEVFKISSAGKVWQFRKNKNSKNIVD